MAVIVEADFLIEVFGRVSPWVTIRSWTLGRDFLAEGSILVSSEKIFVDVC
jgi:hypothetical protein